MNRINTVLGEISPKDLGFTLSHEHFLLTDNAMRFSFPDWIDYPAVLAQCCEDVLAAKKLGISTIIDATPINLGRDIDLLREISQNTGVNIIASTGFYFQEMPWFSAGNCDVERTAELMIREYRDGIGGTDSHPGIIKCATEDEVISPTNELFLKACALAHRETGLPIMTHAHADRKMGLRQQEILSREGVDLSKVIIGHCDDTKDEKYVLEILKNGSYVGLDRMGIVRFNPLKNRIDMAEKLINAGYGDKLVLSHDYNVMSDYSRVGGIRRIRRDDPDCNPTVVPGIVIPELIKRGVPAETIADLKENNIMRFFQKC